LGLLENVMVKENDLKVVVNFPGIGVKKLAPKIVNLERV